MFDPRESVKSVARNLPKAGAADLPEVCAVHYDDAAHFVKTGAHAFSNAIAQGFAARSPLGTGEFRGRVHVPVLTRIVRKICGDDRRAFVIVACGQNEADS